MKFTVTCRDAKLLFSTKLLLIAAISTVAPDHASAAVPYWDPDNPGTPDFQLAPDGQAAGGGAFYGWKFLGTSSQLLVDRWTRCGGWDDIGTFYGQDNSYPSLSSMFLKA